MEHRPSNHSFEEIAPVYSPRYNTSYALVIGIDRYAVVSPLSYAVSDAQGVAEALRQHGFLQENINVLLNEEATSSAIFEAYMRFTQLGCGEDDRIVVFYAGHGHTVSANRGDVGFLVPHDGDCQDLSTLLRWDDFTRNADLIRAKHILFLMDACYGGLAVNRSAPPGSLRFVRDMLVRQTRLVLTAGKANEPVADAGGPLPNHSIFTGHLLQAFAGAASDASGNLTANGIISYVYNAVSRDADSQQTPHYGYLQGDGDMIFRPDSLASDDLDEFRPADDRAFTIPVTAIETNNNSTPIDTLKDLLSEERFKIKLFDFMVAETRRVLAATSDDSFPLQGQVEKEAFIERLLKYESAVSGLIPQQMLLGRWSTTEQQDAATLPVRRLSERLGFAAGTTWLIESRWYPMLLLLYSSGLGAVVGGNYGSFLSVLHAPTPTQNTRKANVLVVSTIDGTGEFYDAFKWIPGREKNYVARSEHLFSVLQPFADDTLFIGRQYEDIFDRVELLVSLEYGNLAFTSESYQYWSPIGRFGWRGRHTGKSPLELLRDEANRHGAEWLPLKAGFFGRSKARFDELASHLETILARLPWM